MTRSNPFRGLMDLSAEMEQMRGLGKTGYKRQHERRERTHADAWAPTADIFRDGSDLVICVELAGLAREDVEVTFSQGVLTVGGERTTGPDLPADAFWKRERPYGAFRRTISLPEHVEDEHISATSRDGLLTVTVSGACDVGASAPRRIPIGGGSH